MLSASMALAAALAAAWAGLAAFGGGSARAQELSQDFSFAPAPGAAGPSGPRCTVALALAIDVSASVDPAEQRLQLDGVAAALMSPRVRDAILSGPNSGVAAAAFAWSGVFDQTSIAPWRFLDSPAAIEQFASEISGFSTQARRRPTAIGAALGHAARLHARNPFVCGRRVVDVAGDGVGNDGLSAARQRARGVLAGLEINGLVIRGAAPDPYPHYVEEVIQGPGAFVIAIDGYEDYERAMIEKLLRELTPMFAWAAPERRRPAPMRRLQ